MLHPKLVLLLTDILPLLLHTSEAWRLLYFCNTGGHVVRATIQHFYNKTKIFSSKFWHCNTLAPYLFIICLDYVLKTFINKMKDNIFKLTKERIRRYPTHTITDAEYANDIVLLANTPTQAETVLHSLEWAAAGIGLHVNADKMEYMCFNQRGNISTLYGSSLKLVKFTYQGSSVSSTETYIN